MSEVQTTNNLDFLKKLPKGQEVSSGFEDLTSSGYPTPIVKIIEGLSPECKADNALYNPNAKPGNFLWPNGCLTKSSDVIILKIEQRMNLYGPKNGKLFEIDTKKFITSWLYQDNEWMKKVAKEENRLKFDAQGNIFSESYAYYLINLDNIDYKNLSTNELTRRIAILYQSRGRIRFAKKFNQALSMYAVGGISKSWIAIWNMSLKTESSENGSYYVLSAPILVRNIDENIYNNFVVPGVELCKFFSLNYKHVSEDVVEDLQDRPY